MRRKTAGLTAAVLFLLSLLCVVSAPASASSADSAPPRCLGNRYDVLFGQAIALSCGYDPASSKYEYRTIAHCTNGSTFWFTVGDFMPYGFGPSTAECVGGLLQPAWVAGYHIDEF
jgi:hypothetical protein